MITITSIYILLPTSILLNEAVSIYRKYITAADCDRANTKPSIYLSALNTRKTTQEAEMDGNSSQFYIGFWIYNLGPIQLEVLEARKFQDRHIN